MPKAKVTKVKQIALDTDHSIDKSNTSKSKQNILESIKKDIMKKDMQSEESEQTWYCCDKCNFCCRLLVILDRHKLSHTEESLPKLTSHSCEFCGKTFAIPARLELHKLTTHRDMKAFLEDLKHKKSPLIKANPVDNCEVSAIPQKIKLKAAEDFQSLLKPHKIKITSAKDGESHIVQQKIQLKTVTSNIPLESNLPSTQSCDRFKPESIQLKTAEVSQMLPKPNKVRLIVAKDSDTLVKPNKIRITAAKHPLASDTALKPQKVCLTAAKNNKTVLPCKKIRITAVDSHVPEKPNKIWLKADVTGNPLKHNKIRLKQAEDCKALKPHKIKLKLAEDHESLPKTNEVPVISPENDEPKSQNTSKYCTNSESLKTHCSTPDCEIKTYQKMENSLFSNENSQRFLDSDSNDDYEPHDMGYDDYEPQISQKYDYYAFRNTISYNNYKPHGNILYNNTLNDIPPIDFEALLKPHQIEEKSQENYKMLLQRHMSGEDFENLLNSHKIPQYAINKELRVVLVRCDELKRSFQKSINVEHKMENILIEENGSSNISGHELKEIVSIKNESVEKTNGKSEQHNISIDKECLKTTILLEKLEQDVKNKTEIEKEKKADIEENLHDSKAQIDSISNKKKLIEYKEMVRMLNKNTDKEKKGKKQKRARRDRFRVDQQCICDYCGYTTDKKPLLTIHMVKHLGTQPYKCNLCNFETCWKNALKVHMRRHEENKPISCDQCSYETYQSCNLKRHMKVHLTNRQWRFSKNVKNIVNQCKICNMCFKDEQMLATHKTYCTSTQATEEVQKCDKCDFTTNYLHILKIHLKTHEKTYFACDNCTYKTTSRHRFVNHYKKHSKVITFACNQCNFRCKRKETYNRHMETHTEIPSFVSMYCCKICNKKFKLYNRYETHVKSHEPNDTSKVAEVFQCELCEYKSKRRYEIKLHMRTHTGERPYQCEFCPHRCATSSHLTVHMRNHTGEKPYFCNACGSTFAQVGSLSRHMKIHIAKQV